MFIVTCGRSIYRRIIVGNALCRAQSLIRTALYRLYWAICYSTLVEEIDKSSVLRHDSIACYKRDEYGDREIQRPPKHHSISCNAYKYASYPSKGILDTFIHIANTFLMVTSKPLSDNSLMSSSREAFESFLSLMRTSGVATFSLASEGLFEAS